MKGPDLFLAYSKMHRTTLVTVSAGLIATIAVLDWKIQPNISLGVLYLLPIILTAGSLSRMQILVVSGLCAVLRETFAPFAWQADAAARIVMIVVAFLGSGLFVSELVRNRQLVLDHLARIQEMEEQVRVLVETSPAAILIVAADGNVLAANQAAQHLLACEHDPLTGEPIASYLPVLSHVLESPVRSEPVRNRVECKGIRRTGEVFLAHVWFASYHTGSGPRLAAIVEDASEDLRDREELGLHSTLTAFRVLTGAVSHEMRNLSAAAAVVHAKLGRIPSLVQNQDYQALGTLVEGLRKIASAELQHAPEELSVGVDLQAALDELRIILEPSLREADSEAQWEIGGPLPRVRGDHHGLLQVFLNLAKNSIRAMQGCPERTLCISAAVERNRAVVRFRDTGPGIASPELLFQPFQPGSDGSGLGLYVSRAMVRAFGGELRHEPEGRGTCFAVGLMAAPEVGAETHERQYNSDEDPNSAVGRPHAVSGKLGSTAGR